MPCALFCSPIQFSKRASSRNLCASLCIVPDMSLQSSHWASVSTEVCRKRDSISRVKAPTSSSTACAYLRFTAAAMVGPALGSWQKAIVAVSKACSRCLRTLARSFCACRCRRVSSAELRANSAATSSIASANVGENFTTSLEPNAHLSPSLISCGRPLPPSLPRLPLHPSLLLSFPLGPHTLPTFTRETSQAEAVPQHCQRRPFKALQTYGNQSVSEALPLLLQIAHDQQKKIMRFARRIARLTLLLQVVHTISKPNRTMLNTKCTISGINAKYSTTYRTISQISANHSTTISQITANHSITNWIGMPISHTLDIV